MKVIKIMNILYFYIIAIIIIAIFLYLYFIIVKEIDYNFKVEKKYLKPKNTTINFPIVEESTSIPRVVYRLEYRNCNKEAFRECHDITLSNISNSKQIIYTDDDIPDFIRKYYGEEVLDIYNSININYGAMRADLVRIMLIYTFGGIYLDYKTAIVKNFDKILEKYPDKLIVSRTSNIPYTNIYWTMTTKYGEYANWGFMANRGNPVLREIINDILINLKEAYQEKEKYNSGRFSVLYLTGPLTFTNSIIRSDPEKYVVLGESFNKCANRNFIDRHKYNLGKHWAQIREPLFN